MIETEAQTTLDYLQSLYPEDSASNQLRFAVNNVSNPGATLSGKILGGQIAVGDEIMVAASLKRSQVKQITIDGLDSQYATNGDIAELLLDDEIKITAGDILHKPGEPLERSNQFQAHLIWLSEDPMLPERSYLIEIGVAVNLGSNHGFKIHH